MFNEGVLSVLLNLIIKRGI